MKIPTKVTARYEEELQAIYHRITKRGIFVNTPVLRSLEKDCIEEIKNHCDKISQIWRCKAYLGKFPMEKGDLNLSSGKQLIEFLKKKGYKLRMVKRSEDEYSESADKLGLIKLFAETADPALKELLDIGKIKKILTTTIQAKLFDDTYYSQYNVAATLTGRRGSMKHILGYGGNAQNIPKYGDLAEKVRRAFIPRLGKIFFTVDQKQAEDWPVSALARNMKALEDMQHGVDRHKNTAAFLFSLPLDQVKKFPHRFLGKKFRHANNYGMWKKTASENLAREGFAFTEDQCEYMLKRMAEYDPNIKIVFHPYIEECLSRNRTLITPFGRERTFLGLRPKDKNIKIFMEAYSYIPQSTVGDNTGFAVYALDSIDAPIVLEGHDSIILEIDDDYDEIRRWRDKFVEAFDRTITMPNGISFKIPLEGELGYCLTDTEKIEGPAPEFYMSDNLIKDALDKLRESKGVQTSTGAVA